MLVRPVAPGDNGPMESSQWLEWAQRLQAIAQTGLAYSKDMFDTERYAAIRSVAAQMMASGCGTADPCSFLEMFKRDAGYATPKVDVRAAAFHAGRVLLVRESEDGRWTLPGGWADVGEAPSLAAVREVKEESGYQVVATKLAAVYDRNQHGHPAIPFHAYKLFFICSITGGAASNSFETDAVDFFEEDRIPPLSTTRVTATQIEHMFGHYRHMDWPTSFD
ncbi:MAG: NUDIX hydrolase [Bryobacteraceae bacterium]